MTVNDPWVRVKDKSTGHHVTVRQSTVDSAADLWQVLKQDAVDHNGDPLPPKYATPSGPADSGQKAETTPKEK